jgi:uncharacterized repeat protein (TIGR03803 family)
MSRARAPLPTMGPRTKAARFLAGAALATALLALGGCYDGGSSRSPPAQAYSLSATISGLSSSGLVLAVNGSAVPVSEGTTTQPLASALVSGTPYSVTVSTQPAGESCSVASGSGSIGSANVANVVVSCADQAYSVGGSITGLGNNSGLVLANGSDTLSVAAAATGFTLPTAVAYSSSYDVTVQSQPAGLACSVGQGAGSMPAAAVSDIQVSCTDQPFSLGGTITGLGGNTGLVLANGSDVLPVSHDSTSFTMPTKVSFASSYSVSVQSSPVGLTCTASDASGTMPAANVNDILISCSDQSYSLGGTINGLSSSGLVLIDGSDTLPVSAGSTHFTMPTYIAYGSPYDVTVQGQPAGWTCTPSDSFGTMPADNVTNVVITCSTNTYTVGGSVSGLNASGLVLLDNGGDATGISANATHFTMNTGVAYGAGYSVTVQTDPTGLACTASNGSGTVGAGDVSNISINCVPNTTVLYAFAGGSTDGATPEGGLVQGSDGNLYGMTVVGGAHNDGVVFKIAPSTGVETVVYSFAGGTDGANPYAGLIQGSDGNLYGTTGAGGASDGGTVFKIAPGTGAESIVYSFAGGSADGASPFAGLIQGSDGNLYGTTYYGGASGVGTVFKIVPGTGAENVVYSFAGGSADGASTGAGLIQGSDGNLYGTTRAGGAAGDGTVFETLLP